MGQSRSRLVLPLGLAAAAALLVGLYTGLVRAPADAVQGEVQRIMYLHLPTVWVAYLAFFVVGAASIVYLLTRREWWDSLAHSSAEIGALFMALTIAAGAIWGKPTWGAWWTWDARITAATILLLIYLGYLMLRAAVEDQTRGARYAAVIGILGTLNIPITHKSVEWWRTLHQPSSMARGAIDPVFQLPLWLNVAAFVLLYGFLLAQRMELGRLEAELTRRRLEE
ncbi:MAG: cytochrome c biogenesis protein CcsA [candidate division NC10 bacterium]|nr:cytochrome c biogenesis protein CcsA [candidate division NC10 bacterium]